MQSFCMSPDSVRPIETAEILYDKPFMGESPLSARIVKHVETREVTTNSRRFDD